MSLELLYTSAEAGLRQGTRGFCTVLSTSGMPVNLATRLETLSGYRHVYSPQDPLADQNPVCWSHVRLKLGGRSVSVLSRIAAYGVDYSGRTNKLAHHVAVEPHEQPPAGPALLLSEGGLMRTSWDGQKATPPAGPAILTANQPPSICERWRDMTGDAGWGGVVADAWASRGTKPQWVVYSLQQSRELLALVDESIALLPEAERWNATFSTYYTNLPPEIDCRVRFVLEGTEEARLAAARGSVINLTRPGTVPRETPLVQLARRGPETASPPSAAAPATESAGSVSSPLADPLDDDEFALAPLQPPVPSPDSRKGGKPPAVGQGYVRPEFPTAARSGRRRTLYYSLAAATLVLLLLAVGVSASRMFQQPDDTRSVASHPRKHLQSVARAIETDRQPETEGKEDDEEVPTSAPINDGEDATEAQQKTAAESDDTEPNEPNQVTETESNSAGNEINDADDAELVEARASEEEANLAGMTADKEESQRDPDGQSEIATASGHVNEKNEGDRQRSAASRNQQGQNPALVELELVIYSNSEIKISGEKRFDVKGIRKAKSFQWNDGPRNPVGLDGKEEAEIDVPNQPKISVFAKVNDGNDGELCVTYDAKFPCKGNQTQASGNAINAACYKLFPSMKEATQAIDRVRKTGISVSPKQSRELNAEEQLLQEELDGIHTSVSQSIESLFWGGTSKIKTEQLQNKFTEARTKIKDAINHLEKFSENAGLADVKLSPKIEDRVSKLHAAKDALKDLESKINDLSERIEIDLGTLTLFEVVDPEASVKSTKEFYNLEDRLLLRVTHIKKGS